MGNCFGKPSASSGDNDSAGPRPSNQVLPAATTAAKAKPKVSGKGYTLGNASNSSPTTAAADAARQAALNRHSDSNKKAPGKIATSLQAQKKMTDRQVLSQAAEDSRRQREIDDQARALRND